jgi:hypothetical protein
MNLLNPPLLSPHPHSYEYNTLYIIYIIIHTINNCYSMIQLLKMDFIIDACENYLRFYGQLNKPPPPPPPPPLVSPLQIILNILSKMYSHAVLFHSKVLLLMVSSIHCEHKVKIDLSQSFS